MPVNTTTREYENAAAVWARCRNTYEGSDAVKAAGTTYLPLLDAHEEDLVAYQAYKDRALFFNATRRTVSGLSGAMFQRAPTLDVPANVESHAQDVTLTGVPFETFALGAGKEVLIVGRYGILVDMASEEAPDQRPYWCGWSAEAVVGWRTGRVGGDEILTRVVLQECVEEEDPKDPFRSIPITQYRVLELVGGLYTQQLWRELKADSKKFVPFGKEIQPKRRGKRLTFIPFVFIGATTITPGVERPPLDDMVLVNLSHYRNSADLEHGLHFTGIPIPWIAGAMDPKGKIRLGPSGAIVLDKGGEVGIIQADGQLLGALEKSLDRKQHMMATLGARLLEDQGGRAETATAVSMRHSGEHATLRTMAEVLEQAFTIAWRWHAWWMGTELTPQDVNVSVDLNKDFFAVKASPEEIKTLVLAHQAGDISHATFYAGLQKGGWAREGVSAEDERAEILREGEGSDVDSGGVPKVDPNENNEDDVIMSGETYHVVERQGQFLVIHATNGDIESTNPTRQQAISAFNAIEG